MLQAVQKAWQIADLRAKILFTLGMLVIYRVIAHVPVPYTDPTVMESLLQNNALLGILNLFSGGALQNFSVAAMGVYPYITASIIVQLLVPLIPALEERSKEGEAGRNFIQRLSAYITVPLALLQAYGQTLTIARGSQGALFGQDFNFSITQNFLPTFTIIVSMTAGTMILVWMAELIDERGIGNGISMIIFGGIVARLYAYAGQFVQGGAVANNVFGIAAFLAITLLTIFVIVIVQEGVRRIPVEYQRRVRGNKVYGGQRTHIPLKVNMAGMIPLIFAQSLLLFPGTIASYFCDLTNPTGGGIGNRIACGLVNNLSPQAATGSLIYSALLFLMVVGFTYFYTVVLFAQQNLPESLKNNGGFIPGIRPGKATEAYLGRVLNRITLAGAVFLGIVAVLPYLTAGLTGVANVGVSSTALLIVVGVAVDTMRQLESQLMMRNYEGYLTR
ncbi:MAG: preprotein translocase subunit SecY [Chloroflexota bacterium]|nr:preprotein translocase subunit SecY [Chloroflexota bacterium]PLS80042.1 MAG: preprotein translocase subunit SecY [Chloroflexota bacterium]